MKKNRKFLKGLQETSSLWKMLYADYKNKGDLFLILISFFLLLIESSKESLKYITDMKMQSFFLFFLEWMQLSQPILKVLHQLK